METIVDRRPEPPGAAIMDGGERRAFTFSRAFSAHWENLTQSIDVLNFV